MPLFSVQNANWFTWINWIMPISMWISYLYPYSTNFSAQCKSTRPLPRWSCWLVISQTRMRPSASTRLWSSSSLLSSSQEVLPTASIFWIRQDDRHDHIIPKPIENFPLATLVGVKSPSTQFKFALPIYNSFSSHISTQQNPHISYKPPILYFFPRATVAVNKATNKPFSKDVSWVFDKSFALTFNSYQYF